MIAQTLTLAHSDLLHTDDASSNLNPTISTSLICDSLLLRSGLQHILRNSPFAITEIVSITGPKRLPYCAPDTALIIIEVTQNTSRALEVVRQVREQSPVSRIIALTDQFDLDFVRSGHGAGVNGFCSTANHPEVLIKSFELVMLGESVLPSEMLHSIMVEVSQRQRQSLQDNAEEPKLTDPKVRTLSMREAEVLTYLREGASNKIIARQCDVTEATIKVHVKAILRKIGVVNRTQAAIWASQHLQRDGASVNV